MEHGLSEKVSDEIHTELFGSQVCSVWMLLLFFGQGLTIEPKLTLNSQPIFLGCLSVETTGVYRQPTYNLLLNGLLIYGKMIKEILKII